MAKKEIKKTSKLKVKKKLWYKVLSPKVFGKKSIGEMYLTTGDVALGRPLRVNLKDLTGNIKDQNTSVGFFIDKVDGSTLETAVKSFQLTTASVKRMVRKNQNRLDDHFDLTTKDGKEARIKVLILTRNKTHQSVRAAIRREAINLFQEEAKKLDAEAFFSGLVYHKIQPAVKRKLSKIYPLRDVAIKVFFFKSTKKQ